MQHQACKAATIFLFFFLHNILLSQMQGKDIDKRGAGTHFGHCMLSNCASFASFMSSSRLLGALCSHACAHSAEAAACMSVWLVGTCAKQAAFAKPFALELLLAQTIALRRLASNVCHFVCCDAALLSVVRS